MLPITGLPQRILRRGALSPARAIYFPLVILEIYLRKLGDQFLQKRVDILAELEVQAPGLVFEQVDGVPDRVELREAHLDRILQGRIFIILKSRSMDMFIKYISVRAF